MLYIDEETSIKRQLTRAKVAQQHNRRVRDAGAGHFFEERATDVDIDKCRKRYGIFKTHYAATLRLKRFFPFTLIDAMGSLPETREQITKELRYQSSLDLSVATYVMIRHLPLAKDIVRSARQELVMRLDGYCEANAELFREVCVCGWVCGCVGVCAVFLGGKGGALCVCGGGLEEGRGVHHQPRARARARNTHPLRARKQKTPEHKNQQPNRSSTASSTT